MINGVFTDHLNSVLNVIDRNGFLKQERLISGPQGGRITLCEGAEHRDMINFCANNYLGLANHLDIKKAAQDAIDEFGFGVASVRFICGTQTLHCELEQAIASYLGKDDAILFAACYDANGGIFETLLGAEDAIISDELNHASIIDGVRLSKAKCYRYANANMDALEDQLKQACIDGARFKLIVTDGVFSMDGFVANLTEICALAEQYGALVMVDDSHATGHLGKNGSGAPSLTGVNGKVDIITGTFGKTLGGAMGDLLLQNNLSLICFAKERGLNLAAGQRHEGAKDFRDLIEKAMKPAQIAEGQTLAREWTAKHK